jgi:hypothetical protein
MRVQLALMLFSMAVFAAGANAADWQPITTELLAKEKPGYGGPVSSSITPTATSTSA